MSKNPSRRYRNAPERDDQGRFASNDDRTYGSSRYYSSRLDNHDFYGRNDGDEGRYRHNEEDDRYYERGSRTHYQSNNEGRRHMNDDDRGYGHGYAPGRGNRDYEASDRGYYRSGQDSPGQHRQRDLVSKPISRNTQNKTF